MVQELGANSPGLNLSHRWRFVIHKYDRTASFSQTNGRFGNTITQERFKYQI